MYESLRQPSPSLPQPIGLEENIFRTGKYPSPRLRVTLWVPHSDSPDRASDSRWPRFLGVTGYRWLRPWGLAFSAGLAKGAQPLPFSWARDGGRNLHLRSSLAPELKGAGRTVGPDIRRGAGGAGCRLVSAHRTSSRAVVVAGVALASPTASMD
jgi:hypothetical protein